MLQSIPPLDQCLGALPETSNCLYIHDVAILPEARGKSASKRVIDLLSALGLRKRLPALAGVSVYGSHRLWRRYGFVPSDDPILKAKAASYGDTATYVVKRLS